jgi:hypothetical protein
MNPATSRTKATLLFAFHQIVGMWGISFLAGLGVMSLFDWLPDSVTWKPSMRFAHWLLTENPFYVVQIVTGVYLGWVLGRRLQHRFVVWVWVLPAAILSYALITVPTLIPEWTSVLARPRTIHSRLSYYFGWGCSPRVHCLDQLLITLPFYASAAYSIGAWFARRYPKKVDRFTAPA